MEGHVAGCRVGIKCYVCGSTYAHMHFRGSVCGHLRCGGSSAIRTRLAPVYGVHDAAVVRLEHARRVERA